jgi:putative endopeptidase
VISIGHGIDDKGSQFNSKGELVDWMTKEDHQFFNELTRPLIEQYQKAGMNGFLTLGENIGDLVGLHASYDATFVHTEKEKNLNKDKLYEEQKLFFKSFARVWCEVQLDGAKALRLKRDPHSLGIARVNELLKHFTAFKEAYQCKDADPMVLPAEKRIRIW